MLFGKKERKIVRLLVVEDEPLVAFDTERFLTDNDYHVVATVDTVAQALACLDQAEIHLVLVDVSLADGSGVDVARQAHRRGVPVMFVTGDCPDGGEAVAAGCLAKPYSPRTLLTAIRAVEGWLEDDPPKRLPSGFRLFARAA